MGSAYDEPIPSSHKENPVVDVRIGVVQSPREIEVELPDGTDTDVLNAKIEAALGSESGVLWLTDRRGRRIGVPSARIAYVEVNTISEERQVGFGSAVR